MPVIVALVSMDGPVLAYLMGMSALVQTATLAQTVKQQVRNIEKYLQRKT